MYPSYVHYFSATYVLYTKKTKKELKKKKSREKTVVESGNPPPVNKEKLELLLFSCYDRRLGRCPRPSLFLFLFYFLLSFFLSVFPRGGKGEGVGGVLRGDLSIGIVFIFIKTFLLSIELLQ